ncbi:MAG TPA: hypothetical protein DGR97_09625 [Gammaproteobacteria bacterium]|nr:hypothetical protein [Gammaproteobacteria bacterium]
MNTSHGIAEVNGTTLFFEQAGHGQPIVFIHGFSLDSRMWESQFETFARNYRVIRYDLRGFGRSAPVTHDPFDPVQDLKELLDYLNVKSATLAGLSLGGSVAIDFALAFPTYTTRLVAADSGLTGYPWLRGRPATEPAKIAATEGIDAAKRQWLNTDLFVPASEQPSVFARLTEYVQDYSGWHWLNDNPVKLSHPPAIERLHHIDCPTLVIIGERDLQDFHEISNILCSKIPGATCCKIPGAGHMANLEDPLAFNAALFRFLE